MSALNFNALNQLFIWITLLLYLGCAVAALVYVRLSAWLWLVAAAFAGIAAAGVVSQAAIFFVSRVQGPDLTGLQLLFASLGLVRLGLGVVLLAGLALSLADINQRLEQTRRWREFQR